MASRLPGRIRLRDRALRDHRRHDALRAELAGRDGMVSVEGNLATGSLLLTYDVARVSPAEMEAGVAIAVASALTDPKAPTQAVTAVRRWRLLRRLNLYAKFGMLGSLAVSLAAAGASKRLHVAAGGLSVALMLVHMAVHRRHLLK